MAKAAGGYIQRLPSGSFRVSVYAGTDPLTVRQIRLRRTCEAEQAAQIELGKLLEQAAAGREPETDATVAQLMDQYVQVADWDLSTRKANDVYIQRVIKPALGHLQVRKIRGALLDLLYAQLSGAAIPCTGKPFIEHRNVPVLAVDPVASACLAAGGGRNRGRDPLRDARRGRAAPLGPGDERPAGRSGGDSAARPGGLAEEGLVVIRQGRTAIVAGDAAQTGDPAGLRAAATMTASAPDASRTSASR